MHPSSSSQSPRFLSRTSAALASGLLLTSLLTACGEQPVDIGVVLPLSGEHQALGESSRNGLELALAEIKAGGDDRFILHFADSASDPQQAATELGRMFDENKILTALGGLTSGEAAALAPVAETAERVLISPSSTSDHLSDNVKHFYRLAPASSISGNSMADFVRREYSIETVATIAEDDILDTGITAGFAATFESQGGEVVARYSGQDATATSQEIAELAPDAVYFDGYAASFAPLLENLRTAGYRGKILTTQSLGTPASLEALGDLAVGVRFTTTSLDTNQEQVAAFVESYRQTYGQDPDLYAAEAYDALQVLYAALANRPSIPSSVRKGLRDDVKSYVGVTGTLQFNEAGSVNKYPKIFRVAEGLDTINEKEWLEAEKARIEDEKRRLREQLERLRNGGAASTAAGS